MVVGYDFEVKVREREGLFFFHVRDRLGTRRDRQVVEKLEKDEADHHAALEYDAEPEGRHLGQSVVEADHVGHHVDTRERVRKVLLRTPLGTHAVPRLQVGRTRPTLGGVGIFLYGTRVLWEPLAPDAFAGVAGAPRVPLDAAQKVVVQRKLVAEHGRAQAHGLVQRERFVRVFQRLADAAFVNGPFAKILC